MVFKILLAQVWEDFSHFFHQILAIGAIDCC